MHRRMYICLNLYIPEFLSTYVHGLIRISQVIIDERRRKKPNKKTRIPRTPVGMRNSPKYTLLTGVALEDLPELTEKII